MFDRDSLWGSLPWAKASEEIPGEVTARGELRDGQGGVWKRDWGETGASYVQATK